MWFHYCRVCWPALAVLISGLPAMHKQRIFCKRYMVWFRVEQHEHYAQQPLKTTTNNRRHSKEQKHIEKKEPKVARL